MSGYISVSRFHLRSNFYHFLLVCLSFCEEEHTHKNMNVIHLLSRGNINAVLFNFERRVSIISMNPLLNLILLK